MTKREAKRRAYLLASLILQNALDAGWQTEATFPDPEEEKKFLDAMAELIAELERRGRSQPVATFNCGLCRRPIMGTAYYQGGQANHPRHKRCLVAIKRSKDGGI